LPDGGRGPVAKDVSRGIAHRFFELSPTSHAPAGRLLKPGVCAPQRTMPRGGHAEKDAFDRVDI